MGVKSASVEWQEAKQRLIEHLDTCPLCRASDCSEAVGIISELSPRQPRQ
jgi:hypothetical protein